MLLTPLPPGWVLITQPGDDSSPDYTVEGVAKFFFARSASWLRLQMSDSGPDAPGPDTAAARVGKRSLKFHQTFSIGAHQFRIERNDALYRVFYLPDIEQLAWAIYDADMQAAIDLYRERVANAAARRDRHLISDRGFGEKRDIYLRRIRAVEERLETIRRLVWYQAELYGMKLPAEFPSYPHRMTDEQLAERLAA